MPDFIKAGWAWAQIIGIAAVLLGVGAAAVFFLGFAWAVIIVVVIGWLCARFVPTGYYGEGSFVVVIMLALLAVGLFIGLVLRLVLP